MYPGSIHKIKYQTNIQKQNIKTIDLMCISSLHCGHITTLGVFYFTIEQPVVSYILNCLSRYFLYNMEHEFKNVLMIDVRRKWDFL